MDWGYGGWFMMTFWVVLIVTFVFLLVKGITQQRTHHAKEDSALEILKKRYARGEIDKEEYEQIKNDIS
jgi:putative membrane protein